MCFSQKQPEAPTNPSPYSPADAWKGFQFSRSDGAKDVTTERKTQPLDVQQPHEAPTVKRDAGFNDFSM